MTTSLLSALLWLLLAMASAREGVFKDNVSLEASWVAVEFDWPNASMRQQYLDTGRYIVRNNAIAGIKVYKDIVYLTVPRWRSGVPSTLNRLFKRADGSAVLQPFPSWRYQTEGDCTALQYVQSMEVDPNTGHMWILDTGRLDLLASTPPRNLCPPKLVIYNTDEDREVRRYTFPNSVVNHTACFLDDLVIDYVYGAARYAYITDTLFGKLYVYNYDDNRSYVFEDPSLLAETEDGVYTVDGIAMSPRFDFVYYSPLDGLGLYQIPTFVLRDPEGQFAQHVRRVGTRLDRSGGLTYGENSLLYSMLNRGGVQRWNVDQDALSGGGYGQVNLTSQDLVIADATVMSWVDSLALDDDDNLWFTTNNLSAFLDGTMDFSGDSGPNMFVWKVAVDESSYLTGALLGGDSRPSSPAVAVSADVAACVGLAVLACLGLGWG